MGEGNNPENTAIVAEAIGKLRQLGKLWPLAPLYGVGLVIHLPYLASLGAKDLPSPEFSKEGQLSIFFYLLYVYALCSLGYFIGQSNSVRFRLIYGLGSLAIPLCALYKFQPWNDPRQQNTYCVIAWIASTMLTGAVFQWVLPWIAKWEPLDPKSNLRFIAGCIGLTTPLCLSAVLYSITILPHTPFWLGGIPRRSVMFKSESAPMLRKWWGGYSEAVWLVYSDNDDYWIEHAEAPNYDKNILERQSRKEMGKAFDAQAEPEKISNRPKPWSFKIPSERK